VEAFLLAYDSNHKPIVGQQITLGSEGGAVANARLDLLLARAEAGDCDLIAKGRLRGVSKGFLYVGGGSFLTDRAATGTISVANLKKLGSDCRTTLTFTCAPRGTGFRAAIDRDDDGVLDGDDPHLE
jgi:hypothetical protein